MARAVGRTTAGFVLRRTLDRDIEQNVDALLGHGVLVGGDVRASRAD
jgi:hypothetical protein